MRLGSHKVRFRVALASVSLAGLGVAAALPMLAGSMAGQQIDPIITQSVDKAATGEPTVTDMPPALPVGDAHMNAADLDADIDAMIDDGLLDEALFDDEAGNEGDAMAEGEAPLRQIIPQAAPSAPDIAVSAPTTSGSTAQTPVAATPDPAPASVETALATTVAASRPASASTVSLAGEAAATDTITLALDHARVLRLVGDVSTIILGNPAIADASMPDPGTLILTGKSYGETNMVMLDVDGNILAERMLSVTVRGQNLVSVYRGVERTTFSCAPTCEIRPTPGDSPEAVQAGLSAFQARNQAALQAVGGTGQ